MSWRSQTTSATAVLDPQFALAYLQLANQYFPEGDRRRANEMVIKVDQMRSRLPRYEQLSLAVLKADRSRDLLARGLVKIY